MMKEIEQFKDYKINESGIIINKKNHVMKPVMNKKGYLRTALETYDSDGKFVKRTNVSIHRLVAQTFIPNPDNLPVVLHLDNDKLNNHVSNLKWGTQLENAQQAYNDGLLIPPNYAKTHTNEYEIYNDENIIKCSGMEGVSKKINCTIGTASKIFNNNDQIHFGEFEGYKIRKTGNTIIKPIYFIDK